MTERREGSTRIIDYREGYEIRIAPAGVWWRNAGGHLVSADSKTAAMRAIDKVAGPRAKRLIMPAPADPDPGKYVPRKPWVEWSTESLPHRNINRGGQMNQPKSHGADIGVNHIRKGEVTVTLCVPVEFECEPYSTSDEAKEYACEAALSKIGMAAQFDPECEAHLEDDE